jgi:haloalkane dehalogenase
VYLPTLLASADAVQIYASLRARTSPTLSPLVGFAPFDTFLSPLIRDNFIIQPSAGPAFVQLAAQFFDEHARNAKHVTALKTLDCRGRGRAPQAQLKNASLTVIPAGHWLQADEPALVAKAMLS